MSNAPYPKIIGLLLLLLAAPLSSPGQSQYHTGYGELVQSHEFSQGVGVYLYFAKPTVEGSAVGTYTFVNTTGQNVEVHFFKDNTDQTINLQGHNNADPRDMRDVVRSYKVPRNTIKMIGASKEN